jgi:hypothetical protein
MSTATGKSPVSEAEPLAPFTNLRGASVQVEASRIGRAVVGLVGAVLLASAILFLFVGLDKNNQITQLQHVGVALDARVSACLGELGGTGSNAAGYSCKGSFTLDQKRYDVTIPGDELRLPGSTVRVVTLPTDPLLVETAQRLKNEHPSAGVFVLPAALFAGLLLLSGAVTARRRASRAR